MFIVNPFSRFSEVAQSKVRHAVSVFRKILLAEQLDECIGNVPWSFLELNLHSGDWANVFRIDLFLESSIVFLGHQAFNDGLIIELDYNWRPGIFVLLSSCSCLRLLLIQWLLLRHLLLLHLLTKRWLLRHLLLLLFHWLLHRLLLLLLHLCISLLLGGELCLKSSDLILHFFFCWFLLLRWLVQDRLLLRWLHWHAWYAWVPWHLSWLLLLSELSWMACRRYS